VTDDATNLSTLRDFYHHRRIGDRVGFGRTPAVVVVDMSIAFNTDSYSVGNRDDSLIASVRLVLTEARAAKCPVVYATTAYEHPDQAGYWGVKIPGLLELAATDCNAVRVHPDLAPTSEDIVISKHYSSAFFGTDLQSHFTRRGVDTLIVTGCSTSGCVRATVVDAVSSGYRVIVPRQAVGDRAQLPHEAALFDIDSKYGDVVDIAEVTDYLRSLSALHGYEVERIEVSHDQR
jgi:nicotinamidase-related amidase